MKHHIFVFPSSYTALIYVIIVSTGLLLSLFVGLWMHPDELLFTHCRVEEYWPSISTLTGDFQPERQIWRSAFVLCAPFRLGATISLFALFWERACGDMKDLRGMVRSPMMLCKSSAALTLVMFFCDLLRLIGALAWTMIASSEDLGRHNLGFAFYILMGFFMQLLIDIIVRRNIYNLAMYASVEEARLSARLKRCFLIGQTTSAVCLVLFYVRHLATCAPGAYSLSTMCEWLFAVFNICFDASTWLDLKKSRWTFGSTPENYKEFLSKNMKEQKTEKQHNNVERGPEEYHPMITGVAVSSEDYSESGTTGVVVHEFTFCCPPSNTAMWLVDTYWAYMFWEMIVHVVQHMYFMPLVAMSISFELLGMLAFCSPVLLIFSPFRRWALGTIPFPKIFLRGGGGENGGIQGRKVPMYILFYLMTSFSHIHVHVRNSERLKLLMTMVGPFFVSLATFCRFLYPSTPTVDTIDASCRMLYTFPLGLVVTMLVRVLYISQDPVFTDAVYAGLFGIVLGITCTTVLYRYVMYSEDASTGDEFEEVDNNNNNNNSSNNNNNNKNNYYNGNNNANGDQDRHVHFSRTRETNVITTLALAYKPFSPTIMGLVFGALSIISLTFYTCANYIPRLMAVDPYPANLLVVFCFVLGLYYSQDIVSLVTPSKRGLFLWGRLGAGLLGGCLLLLFATRQTNRSYELRHPHYPTTMESLKENVDIRFWAVEEDFAGNKYVAFCGGLIMTVCFGALYPVVMELVFVNQRARRLAYVNTGKLEDSHGSQTFKQLHVSSFELVWATTTIVGLVLFALCISYPFVPMAWLIRERSVSMHFGVMAAVFVLTFFMSRRVKNAVLVTGKDPNSTRKQRRMPFVIFIFICFAFFAVVVGRFTLAPGDRSIREGNDAARRFPSEVVTVHKALLRLKVEKNKITDPLLEDYEMAFIDKRYESKMWELNDEVLWEEQSESKIVANAPRGKFGLALQHLSPEEKMQVWEAAKGMTFFSGMIWTVHFALDNRNTDSLSRMAKQVELTGAGVIGILESDTMHLTNGNRDIVEFLSYSLGYRYTSYGPTALDNTYGCALISKYPITSVRRYTMPSPQGELSCLIHAQLDVFGLRVHAYVSHFGNTEHWGDGLLQSQFLARVVKANPGPSVFLGYIVSYPGNPERYEYYASQSKKGYLRDAALVLYRNRSWERLWDRGGYDEPPPERTTPPPGEPLDFNVEWKLEKAAHLEAGMTPDVSFRRTPPDRPPRYFRHNTAQRITTYHPRMEFIDRYCEYIFYKTGATKDENPEDADKLQPLQMYLFDWWRVLDGESLTLSDTEIQVVQLGFQLQR